MASLDRQPAQPHDGIEPSKQQKHLAIAPHAELPQQAFSIHRTLHGLAAPSSADTAQATHAVEPNLDALTYTPSVATEIVVDDSLQKLERYLNQINEAIVDTTTSVLHPLPTHLIDDLKRMSVARLYALNKIEDLRQNIRKKNLSITSEKNPRAIHYALEILKNLETKIGTDGNPDELIQLIGSKTASEKSDQRTIMVGPDAPAGIIVSEASATDVTSTQWNSILSIFENPKTTKLPAITNHETVGAFFKDEINGLITTCANLGNILGQEHFSKDFRDILALFQKIEVKEAHAKEIPQLCNKLKTEIHAAVESTTKKLINKNTFDQISVATQQAIDHISALQTACVTKGFVDSERDKSLESNPSVTAAQPTSPATSTTEVPTPKTFGDTLRSWGKSIKEFISPSTVTGKHVQKRQSTTGWLAVGLAGLMSYFGNKQADTPTSHVAPTTIEAVGPQKNVETVTAVVAEGSVHAGLDAQHRKNASVQRGLENALDQHNGRQILAALYPGEVITSAEHTYLSDTISDRIQKALPNSFHTHNNNETIAVSHTGSTKAGLETFVVTMTSSEAHRSHTATVNIAIPSSTTVHRQAVHHVAALRHQNNSQPQPATTAATDASLAPAALARQNDRLTQELTGGSNIVSDMTIATPRNPQQDMPNTAAMPPLDSRGTDLPQFPAQTDRVEAVRTAPEQNLNLSEAARIVSTLNLFANHEPTNPAQFRFNTESGSNGSAISLTVISGDNELVVPFNGLQFQNGTVTCTVGGSRMPLTVAIENALRTHPNQARVLSGAAARAIVDVMSHRQPLSSHNTIINSGPDLVHAELAKLAASDAEKDRIPNKIAAMQRAARERLDAYYATREREAQARKQMRAQITEQL